MPLIVDGWRMDHVGMIIFTNRPWQEEILEPDFISHVFRLSKTNVIQARRFCHLRISVEIATYCIYESKDTCRPICRVAERSEEMQIATIIRLEKFRTLWEICTRAARV